jgi:hypothetical protein
MMTGLPYTQAILDPPETDGQQIFLGEDFLFWNVRVSGAYFSTTFKGASDLFFR